MDSVELFHSLLEIGRAGTFDDLPRILGTPKHQDAFRLADAHRAASIAFVEVLTLADRIAFVKAIAKLEHLAGGFGSVTALERLLPLLQDQRRTVLDWILRNTDSYWYYGYGAKSIKEYDETRRLRAEIAADGVRRDLERQARDKARIAGDATAKLYSAIRRGDVKAVRALLAKGANPHVAAPDGTSLMTFAHIKGNGPIVQQLEVALDRYV